MVKWLVSTLFFLGFFCDFLYSQESIPIWKGTEEKAKRVTLTSYLPKDGANHVAVIVCPGGSYCWLDHESEGALVGEWLRKSGISAFVLEYRTAGFGAFFTHYRGLIRGNQHPDMIKDIQRSIQLVRENAKYYNIAADRVGVMGFSAGGHLAMSSVAYCSTNFLAPLNIIPKVSLRPDFAALIYPVVTLSDKRYAHRRSCRGLLGEWKIYSPRMLDSLSLEKHISANCPPVFLLNCKDDPIVKYQNSKLLDSALTAYSIPHKYLQYKTGGHGFGASDNKGTKESGAWKDEFINWLNTLF